MDLDGNGSKMTYAGDEGTVSRYQIRVNVPANMRPIVQTNTIELDVLVDNAGTEHPIVVVQPGQSTEGIVTNGRAKMVMRPVFTSSEKVGVYANPGDAKPLAYIPDGFTCHVDPESVISYMGPRLLRFRKELAQ